ncbi:MAG: glycosyltransferase family 39 protein [Myxococcota bacterium]|nr:glycosyltransferase family 39 protein [Myxococcota bacterium]
MSRPAIVAPLLFLASVALSYLFADRYLPSPDEGASLAAAAKILDGAVFYRDIDAYPFPGAAYLLALGMAIFGEHLSVARGLAGAGFVCMVLSSYAAALVLVDRPRAALFGVALLSLKFLVFPNFTMFVYPDFAMTAAMTALAIFLRHPYRGASIRLVVAGIFAGLAVVTKQNVGLYVGLAMAGLLLWPEIAGGARRAVARHRWSEVSAFVAGIAVPVGIMASYFAAQGLLGRMIYSGLLRPFVGYLPTSGVSVLPPLQWWELGSLLWPRDSPYLVLLYGQLLEEGILPGASLQGVYALAGEVVARLIYTGLPVAFLGCAFLWLRMRRSSEAEPAVRGRRVRFFGSAAVCLAITASAFPRADMSHILLVYPAVLLTLFSLLVSRALAGGDSRPAGLETRMPTRLAAVVVAFVATTGALAIHHDSLLERRLTLERAELWVRPKDMWVQSLVQTVRERVPEGEPLFIYGHEAQLYFMADRYFPWPFTQLYPGMAGGGDGDVLARILVEQRPRLIVQGVTHWPGMPTLTEYTAKLVATIERDYVRATKAMFLARPPQGTIPPSFILQLWRLRGGDSSLSGEFSNRPSTPSASAVR